MKTIDRLIGKFPSEGGYDILSGGDSDDLEHDIQASGHQYLPVRGVFEDGTEMAFVVIAGNKFAQTMRDKHNLDSVLVAEPGGKMPLVKSIQMYFTRNGRKLLTLECVKQPGTINGVRSRSMKGEICELAGYDRRRKS